MLLIHTRTPNKKKKSAMSVGQILGRNSDFSWKLSIRCILCSQRSQVPGDLS